MTIKIIPISELAAIYPEFTAEFFDEIASHFPNYIKNTENAWLINNQLTINSVPYMQKVEFFSVLLHISQQECQILQISKNK